MSGTPDLDRSISAWLDDRALSHAPDDLLGETLARTSRLRRRPAWRIPERWIPLPLTLRLAVMPRVVIYLLVLALLIAMLAAGGLVAGSLRNAAVALPPPTGPAKNGLIAWDAQGDIWVANPDGSDPHAITSGPDADINPVWSPDGTRLAYWSLENPNALPPTIDRVGSLVTTSTGSLIVMDGPALTPTTIVTGVRLDSAGLPISWAPDGDRMVYATSESGGAVIWTVGLDGHDPVRLADGDGPTWSPDGQRIAYRLPAVGVMLISPDGTDATRLSQATGSGFAFELPQWSPDGRSLTYYAADDGAHDIWVIDADGTNERAVSTAFEDEYWPYWSPDGSRIAFGRTDSGQTSVQGSYVLIDPDGNNKVVLGLSPLGGGAPTTWSPDGTMLLGFLAEPSGGYERGVVLLDTSGADPVVLRSIPTESPWNSGSWQRLAP